MGKFLKLDAAESAFFERQLEHIYSQTYDIKFATLRARDFVPVSNVANAGATSVTYRQMDRVGRAKVISNNAKDLPRVDVFGEEFNRPVREVGASYGWNIKELRSAQMAGENLNARRASAARRAIEEELDAIACFGSPENGIADGFLNNPNVPSIVAAATWPLPTTPDDIIGDIGSAVQRIVNLTLGVEMPDTILLPTDRFALIATTRLTDSDRTILDFVRASFPMITSIEPWYRLDTAGAGATRRMVVYKRSPDILTQEIPSEFEQLPVQEMGLEFIVNAMASTAGTALYYPLAVDFTDTI